MNKLCALFVQKDIETHQSIEEGYDAAKSDLSSADSDNVSDLRSLSKAGLTVDKRREMEDKRAEIARKREELQAQREAMKGTLFALLFVLHLSRFMLYSETFVY